MKLRCPRCQQKITVPDEWASKAIRCSSCNKAFQVPKPKEMAGPLPGEQALDLEHLARLESKTGGLEAEELATLEAGVPMAEDEEGPPARVCPHCNKRVTVKDKYAELLCSHCGRPIPALKRGAGVETGEALLVGARNLRSESKIGFYEGLATVFTYPIGAVGSLMTAVLIAIGAILLPVTLATALARTTEQSQVGLDTFQTEDLSGVETAVMGFFWIEVLFFAAVGIHGLVEVTRASSMGDEKPPSLVWNPVSWGESLLGYLALLIYYGLFFLLAIMASSGEGLAFPTTQEDFRKLATPTFIGIAGVMTFFVPMTLIGMSCGKLTQALNPVRIGKSIAATHVNYIFLFLWVVVLMSLFIALFGFVAAWFGGEIRVMQRAARLGNIPQVAGGLVSWGLVMGLGFYSVYVVGRLHGLFARTFRKQLEFSS